MPFLDGFFADPKESESVIDQLMIQIPIMFADSRETEIILGPAIQVLHGYNQMFWKVILTTYIIQAGVEALKAAGCAGKILLFNSSLPVADAPGKLENRDDRKLLGTDKEKSVIAPHTTFYNQLGTSALFNKATFSVIAMETVLFRS